MAQGYKVVGMKPVAAGCDLVNGEWVNDDVLKLEAASNVKVPRALTNPYSFKQAIAPHLAAELAGTEMTIAVMQHAFEELSKLADIVIVEGAGGFLVPINYQKTLADFVKAINIPIVLVVGIKLGCINHTMLTIEAIKARNCELHGWIANPIDSQMQHYNENVLTIVKMIQKNSLILG